MESTKEKTTNNTQQNEEKLPETPKLEPEVTNIRQLNENIKNFFTEKGISKKTIGMYYQWAHNLIIYGGGFLILFNSNPVHLIILLIIITLDGVANTIRHDCPLTQMEKKYLGTSLSEERKKVLADAGILYKSTDNIYESQFEVIVNMWTLTACKILIILIIKSFTPSFILSCCGESILTNVK
jgi:hypothetical protein